MNTVLTARYSMIADLYSQKNIQNESGQINREWDRQNPFVVKNLTEAILIKGSRGDATTEKWSEFYEPYTYAKMFIATNKLESSLLGPMSGSFSQESFTPDVVTRRFRVGNIRKRSTNELLWINDKNQPMEFNIMGINLINDPFGRIVEYELLIKEVVDA